MTTPPEETASVDTVESLLSDIEQQVAIASFPDAEGQQVVTLAWLSGLLQGNFGTFTDGDVTKPRSSLPIRLRALVRRRSRPR